jgi:hypothetical protein
MRGRARLAVTCAGLALLAGCAPRAVPDRSGSDPRAVAIADRVIESLGGRARWEAAPGLRWTFGSMLGDSVRSSRRHAWDKRTGWHRVEGTTRQGRRFVILHVVGDSTRGMAWMDGQRIEAPDSLSSLLRRGEALWVNDTYWMLMPYKLRDPGVTLGYAGDTTLAGVTYDRLALSFHGVGLTPGDHYWVFVNRANHRVEYWEMVLEGDEPPPVGYTWEGWEEHGGLWFPTAHRRDSVNVFTNAVEVVPAFAAAEFREP